MKSPDKMSRFVYKGCCFRKCMTDRVEDVTKVDVGEFMTFTPLM